jgi:hypothetical protein
MNKRLNGSKWIRPTTRLAVHLRHGFRCVWCARDLATLKPKDVTLDHIIPREAGGTHAPGNVASACLSCNSARGDTDAWDWCLIIALRNVGLDPYGDILSQGRGAKAKALRAHGAATAHYNALQDALAAPLNRALARAIIRGDAPDPRPVRRKRSRREQAT